MSPSPRTNKNVSPSLLPIRLHFYLSSFSITSIFPCAPSPPRAAKTYFSSMLQQATLTSGFDSKYLSVQSLLTMERLMGRRRGRHTLRRSSLSLPSWRRRGQSGSISAWGVSLRKLGGFLGVKSQQSKIWLWKMLSLACSICHSRSSQMHMLNSENLMWWEPSSTGLTPTMPSIRIFSLFSILSCCESALILRLRQCRMKIVLWQGPTRMNSSSHSSIYAFYSPFRMQQRPSLHFSIVRFLFVPASSVSSLMLGGMKVMAPCSPMNTVEKDSSWPRGDDISQVLLSRMEERLLMSWCGCYGSREMRASTLCRQSLSRCMQQYTRGLRFRIQSMSVLKP